MPEAFAKIAIAIATIADHIGVPRHEDVPAFRPGKSLSFDRTDVPPPNRSRLIMRTTIYLCLRTNFLETALFWSNL